MNHPTGHGRLGYTAEEFRALPLEVRLRLLLSLHVGWGYDFADVEFAYEIPGAPSRFVVDDFGMPSTTNCSTLTASLVTGAFPTNPWNSERYAQLQVFFELMPRQPDAPIQAVIAAGVGGKVAEFVDGAWHLVQGWSRIRPDDPAPGQRYRGHAFLIKAVEDGDLLMLEASRNGYGGPRFRIVDLAGLKKQYPKGLHIGVLGAG